MSYPGCYKSSNQNSHYNNILLIITQSDIFNFQETNPPSRIRTQQMSQEYKIDDISSQLRLYLSASARRHAFITKPLILKTEFRTLPAVSDSTKNSYQIDMSQLMSFREHFTDKQYKYIRLHQWEFIVRFDGRKCKGVELVASHIALIANKNLKKEIKDCNFTIIVANSDQINKFQKQYKGYLNRLAKRNLVTLSEYVAQEHYALINFVKKPLNFNAVEKICMLPPEKAQQDPLLYLNSRGKQVLQKLKHFITRQNLFTFMVDQQLSDEGEKQMRRVILSDVLGNTKKKGGYQRTIVQALQRNLVD